MKRCDRIGPILAIMMFALFATNLCPAGDTIKVIDTANRPVEVKLDPQRIVCLAPGTLRLVCLLKATDKLVGIEDFEKTVPMTRPYIMVNAELTKLPIIGSGGPDSINRVPDLEALLKVRPDIIFISYMEPSNADDLQKKLSIPVVVLTHGRFASFDERIFDSLRILGKILKKEQRAEEVIAFINQAREDLHKRSDGVSPDKKPSVYAGAIGYKAVQGIESTDTTYTPLEWVQARNSAKSVSDKGHLFIDREKLLTLNPDVIFIDGGGLNVIRQDFRRRPEFYKSLKALQNKEAYVLFPFNYYVTNVCIAIADSYAVGKILYPERFSDIDISHKADEIFTFLYGKPVYEKMVKTYGTLGQKVDLDLQ
ncbi:iron ABC transporter substrate-binding protein [Desulfomonile tiedjei]|uniref:ABC-type Fe3+-hydroxamate transport system, periplasmic component n=1 Tax=Desulfomonile tiedjei (strain ATCC 49306 / DSM 6799 / DCB-1) TaxID=706587 RepID=I4C0B0_DESTA|nr:iron ABC transporter substrate-binding protein [Desulfomonile tiedjei]AFM23001.1 ABC-type Fe3+-hydroxamate transport system, periplasmic component [Desulfomonile tiedjei DSM 6799]